MNNIQPTLHMVLYFRHSEPDIANWWLDMDNLLFGGCLWFIVVAKHKYRGVLLMEGGVG